MLSAGHLAEILTGRFGVAISGEAIDDSDGKRAIFRPLEIPPTQGFAVEVLIGWRTVEAQFVSGTYAAQLLGSMGNASPDQRAVFGTFIRSAMNDGAKNHFSHQQSGFRSVAAFYVAKRLAVPRVGNHQRPDVD